MSASYYVVEARRIRDYQKHLIGTLDKALQLSRGQLHATAEVFQYAGLTITRRTANQALLETGRIPNGFIVFNLHRVQQPFYSDGIVFHAGDISVERGGNDFSILSSAGCHYISVKIPEAALFENSAEPGLANSKHLSARESFLALSNRHQVDDLFTFVDSLFDRLTVGRDAMDDAEFSVSHCTLCEHLCAMMVRARPQTLRTNTRVHIFRRALHFIHLSSLETLGVDQVAESINTSRRNLELVFSRCIGISPKEYINNLRLGAIHDILLRESPKTATVSEIANRYGFIHMGHFGRIYSQLFQELPSETLKASS